MSKEATVTKIVDIGVVGVPVTSQERALEFYVGKLGFEKRADAPMPNGGRWVMVAPPAADTAVALVAATEDIPTWVETGIRFISTDAAADRARMAAFGVDVGELLRWPGVPAMFAFRDQDNNRLEVIEAND